MPRRDIILVGLLLSAVSLPACSSRPVPSSASSLNNSTDGARTVAFEEVVFGTKVSDPYRWMEDPANAGEMTDWVRRVTAGDMKQLAVLPGRTRLRDALLTASSAGVSYRSLRAAGERLFALRLDPDAAVAKLVMREKGTKETVLFDPAVNAGNKTVAIDSYAPSPSGRLVAIHTAEGGGEVGPIRFLDVTSGRWLDDVIQPVWGEFFVSWIDDDTALFTRMGPSSGDPLRNLQAGIHRIGRPAAEDRILLTPDVAPEGTVQATEMPVLQAHPLSSWVSGAFLGAFVDGRVMVASIRDVRAGRGAWRAVAGYDDRVSSWDLSGDSLYALVTRTAPNGEIRRIDAANGTAANAELILPASDKVLSGVYATTDGLYVTTLKDGVNGLLFLPGGKPPAKEVALEPATIAFVWATGDARAITFAVTTWTRNVRFLRAEGGVVHETGVASASHTGADRIEATATEAVSADGTRVPLVLSRRGTPKNGMAPTLLDAYGSYGIAFSPAYTPYLFPWIERGGIYAVCGVRGGGEKGRAWHEAGRGPNKPNSHTDLVACAERLQEAGYTGADHLAVTGTSAGGVLAPPTALKRPDLFRVVLSRVAIVNPTRIAVAENGPNQFREMGDPQTEPGFKGLALQDAYLMLDTAADMPDWFITVGLNDHRVAPWMNAKFAAKALRKAAGTGRVVFIRADAEVGHGIGTTRVQEAEEWADAYSFLLNRFGDVEFGRPDGR